MATTNKFFRVKNGLEVVGAEFRPAQGTSSYPPILLPTGVSLLTTAAKGAFEFDGTNFYLTPSDNNRKTIAYTDTTPASHTHGNITNGGAVGSTANLVLVTGASGAVTVAATPGTPATQFLRGDLTWVVPTDTNYYPSAVTMTAPADPTTAGPAVGLTMNTGSVTSANIPVASITAAGVVTTGTQAFLGIKTFTSPSITTSLTTTSASFDLLTSTATTLNIGSAATTLTIGNTATAAQTVNMFTAATAGGTYNIATAATSSGTKTVNIGTGGGAGSTTTINIGTTAGTSPSIALNGAVAVNGAVTIAGNLTVNGITTTLNSNTLVVDDKNLELGSVTSGLISATGTVGTVVGSGPYTSILSGMSTTTGLIPGQTITATGGTGSFGSGTMTVLSIIDNVSIGISSTATFSSGTVTNVTGSLASDASADGGGITLKGTTDKTFQWADTGDNWTSSENLSLAANKAYKIDNANVISGSATALVVGGGASTTIAIGANGGTATILNPTVTLTNATVLNINGATQSIVGGTVAGTASVFNTNTGTVNLGGAASIVNIGGGAGKTTNIAGTGASLINIGSTSIGNTNTSIVTIGSGGAGTGAKQQIVIGNHSGSVGIYETYIGATTVSSFTTIQGTVKLPSIGTSGFVKLGTGGELSADTATYVSGTSPTISDPTLTGTVYLDDGAIETVTFTTSGTTPGASAAIFDTTVFTGAEIVIKAKNGTTLEIIKALVLIDSTGNVYNTQYADILTGTQLIGTLDYTTTSNEFKISITPFAGTTGTTTYKAVLTLIEA